MISRSEWVIDAGRSAVNTIVIVYSAGGPAIRGSRESFAAALSRFAAVFILVDRADRCREAKGTVSFCFCLACLDQGMFNPRGTASDL